MTFHVCHRTRYAVLAWLLTALRMALAPILWSTMVAGETAWPLALLGFACVSDSLDGRLARRNAAASRAGMYFDTTADFAVVAAGMAAFIHIGTYPQWCLLITVAMYLQFVFTSLCGRIHYDPLGKHYGGFLYGLVGLSVIAPFLTDYGALTFACFTGACIVSRTRAALSALFREKRGKEFGGTRRDAVLTRSS